jgi:hypothetical protein
MSMQIPKHRIAVTRIVACTIVMYVIVFPACADDADGQPTNVASQPSASPLVWSLQLPKEEMVIFRGVVNFDSAGADHASMLYPAPDAVGFLAGVLAHGLIVNSARKSQKDKLQETADQVLAPYRTVLDSFTSKDLVERALKKATTEGQKRIVNAAELPDTGWLIESTPVFAMTQDQRAIMLDNTVTLRAPGNVPATETILKVRVVSHPLVGTDQAADWTVSGGEKLKEVSAEIFAESLDTVFREAANRSDATNAPQKTIRYLEGTSEKIERAQLISTRCHRLVIKNLRGWLMSVPIAAAEKCEGAADRPQ